MRVLVTGGAGYIGSVTSELLVSDGHSVVVLDNLKQGFRAAVAPGAVLIEGSVGDRALVRRVFEEREIQAVIHLAGESIVGESMAEPRVHFHANLVMPLNLLDAMVDAGVRDMIFSSSAAVYGPQEVAALEEEHPPRPISPYGESKWMFEKLLHWYRRAYGLNYVVLRYFNAAGASSRYGEAHEPETHLVPVVLEVARGEREKVEIYGSDFQTPDGTCIRDYIHVVDIARAHVMSLMRVAEFGERVFNLGTGRGFSVREILESARAVTGREIEWIPAPRRRGDVPVLVAKVERAWSELGWKAERSDLVEILESAWRWKRDHPKGYGPR